MYVSACVCVLVVEPETVHVSTEMKNYVVLELSERKELAFKNARCSCLSVRQKFPVYSTCLWLIFSEEVP